MQANAPFPPPNRLHDLSPTSTAGSEWSGMNNYNAGFRPEGPYNPLQRGDSATPPDPFGTSGPPPALRANTFGPSSSPTESRPRRPSESGSRASSRTGSVANSRSSDGTISDQQSRKYMRMQAELKQHYKVLQAYLRGGAPQPPRPNKARDKLLRLSQVQFHELSTDVFDELQRRQAAAPLPGRPPRQERVPPFLQPRPNFHEKRNQARQKLSSLQTVRFRDLSTDVFCELERRFPHFAGDSSRRDSSSSQSRRPQSRPPTNGPPPATNGFGPPPRAHTANGSMSQGRNASRGRQGSLPGGVPQFDNPPAASMTDYARPMPKQFQSNTITPNKSVMVEDDEDDQYEMNGMGSEYTSSDAFGMENSSTSQRSDRDTAFTSQTGGSRDMKVSPRATDLQDRIADLEAKLKSKDDEIRDLMAKSQSQRALEQKSDDAENFIKALQDEVNKLRSDHARSESDLKKQLDAVKAKGEDSIWQSKHEKLEREHQDLQAKFAEQRKITEEVREQGQTFLKEMRLMAEGNGTNMEREEKLHTEVQKLQEEVQEWRARYAKAKTQLRSVRASTLGLNMTRTDIIRHAKDGIFHGANGMVKDVHITKFQITIDELLKLARSDEPTAVLDHMKAVILAVRGITGDVENATPNLKDEETTKKVSKLKHKVSATANNLITASKNYAAADGLSPVSLVDAAASHLTAAVVDLLRLVKVRPTPSAELEHHDDIEVEPVEDGGYFNITAHNLRRRSAADSVYSALSDPAGHEGHSRSVSQNLNGLDEPAGLGIQTAAGLRQDEMELEELKVYLGNQTDLLVHSVQELVGSVRNESGIPTIRNHISTIVDIVENVLDTAEGSMEDDSTYQASLQRTVMPIIGVLKSCKARLEQAGYDSQRHEGQPTAKSFVQNLPPLAFQIARETKELVSRVENVGLSGSGDEDFS